MGTIPEKIGGYLKNLEKVKSPTILAIRPRVERKELVWKAARSIGEGAIVKVGGNCIAFLRP